MCQLCHMISMKGYYMNMFFIVCDLYFNLYENRRRLPGEKLFVYPEGRWWNPELVSLEVKKV